MEELVANPTVFKDLSIKEKRVADEYFLNGCQNATKAYQTVVPEASTHTAAIVAGRILKRPHVVNYLQTLANPPELQTEIKNSRQKFLDKVERLTKKAEDARQYSAAFKGCDIEAKVNGLYEQEESDTAQYLQFFDKVSITVNQGREMKVIEHEDQGDIRGIQEQV